MDIAYLYHTGFYEMEVIVLFCKTDFFYIKVSWKTVLIHWL